MKKAEAELIAEMEAQEIKSTSTEICGIKYTTTATQRTSYSFDEAGLKKALGARVYNKFTIAKLDRTKLEEAVQAGAVDAGVVSQYATPTTSAQGIRLTKKAASDEADEA